MANTVMMWFLAAILALIVQDTLADFFWNHPSPKQSELKRLNLKCIPGRTIITIGNGSPMDGGHGSVQDPPRPRPLEEDLDGYEIDSPEDPSQYGDTHPNYYDVPNSIQPPQNYDSYNSGDIQEFQQRDTLKYKNKSLRRFHMNSKAEKEETCKICVCSAEGKDEYCSKRPAKNVNECLMMLKIKQNAGKNPPFNFNRDIPWRIRREGSGKDEECIPHISVYTDCTEVNKCTGCSKCDCTAEGKWNCNKIYQCSQRDVTITKKSLNKALNTLITDMRDGHDKNNKMPSIPHVKAPPEAQERRNNEKQLLGYIIAANE